MIQLHGQSIFKQLLPPALQILILSYCRDEGNMSSLKDFCLFLEVASYLAKHLHSQYVMKF